MEEWVVWMVAAGVLAVGEILTMGFFLGPVAIAAVMAGAVALAGGGLALQLVVFISPPPPRWLSCARSRGATCRPRAHFAPAPPRSWASTRWCSSGWTRDGGSVKLGGEVWSARAFDEDDVLEPGPGSTY